MSQKPNRTLLYVSVTLTVVLLVVAIGAAAYYYSATDAIAAKDAEILHLRAQGLSQNVTVLQLQLSLLELDSNITSLQKQLAGLLENQTRSEVRFVALSSELVALEDQSALLGMELAVAQQAGGFSVAPLVSNSTAIVPPSSTVGVLNLTGGRNGTLAFVSLKGCPSSGDRVQVTGSGYALYILLNDTGSPLRSDFRQFGTHPFAVSLENVGRGPVLCTFSLFFVQS